MFLGYKLYRLEASQVLCCGISNIVRQKSVMNIVPGKVGRLGGGR